MIKCRKAFQIVGYFPLHNCFGIIWKADVFRARNDEDPFDELSAETEYHHVPNEVL